jgi:hypothetical protein
MLSLRTTSYYKIIQDIARFVCNVLYLLNATDEAADASVEVMTYFNMAASVATIVLAGMVAVMKNSLLMEVEATSGTAADTQVDDSGRRSSFGGGGGADGSIDMMEVDGGAAAWASNPMHDDTSDSSTIFVRNPPETSVRTLIVQLLPDIDGPSLHGVDQAIKSDGVYNMKELKMFLENGLIGIPELKQYANQGNLPISDIMVLVTSLKPFMVAAAPAAADEGSRSTSGGGGGGGGDGDGGRFGGSVHTVLNALNYLTESIDELREIPKDKRRTSMSVVSLEEARPPQAPRASITRPPGPRPIVRAPDNSTDDIESL